ncbi:MAG: extracellular solute-binding protein [Lachnospiraceae bacterium]
MRKYLSIFMVGTMVLGLAGCQAQKSKVGENTVQTAAVSDNNTESAEAEPAESEALTLEQTKSLVLYTSASTTEYELIVELFSQKYPDIQVEIVSAGTGELSSRIVAEAANPSGDILMGGGTSTYEGIFDYLDEYKTENINDIFTEFRPSSARSTPCYINVNSIIVNNSLANDLGVTVDGWDSLTNEALKGKMAFADPSASSSALEQLVNILTAMSTTDTPEGGWEFAEIYLRNLDSKLSSSSSACYKGVVEGEYVVGLTNEDKAISYLAAGADVSVVYPKEGITLRTSNLGIIKGGTNAYNARLFVDFITSYECQKEMEAQLFVRPVREDVPMTTEGRVATADLVSIEYPTEWVVENSDSVKVKFQDIWTSLD